ncbi:MAG: PilZ domain-containing protein, partial [Candidatus Omnitrophota bacterium]
MTQEKRKHKRLMQKMHVRHRVENEHQLESTEAKDISTGGLRITTDSRLNVGSKICIEMNLSSSTLPYYAIGEVIWFKENDAS